MVLPMEIFGPVIGIGSLMMIGASAIVMIRRLAPRHPVDTGDRDHLLEEIHGRLEELDHLRQRVSELEERVDFTERVLAKQRATPRIAPPPAVNEISGEITPA